MIDLSSISMASHQIKNRGPSAEFRLALDGEALAQQLPRLGVRVREIAEGKNVLRTGVDAGRLEALRQPFLAEVAFFHHALGARGEIGIDAGNAGPRIFPVEAARAVGTRSNAIAAADAAVPIHHHDAVIAFECGLRRANARARRIGAVIAK